MGQKPSKSKIPLFWLLRFQRSRNPNPEQPIRFQYKTRRKNIENPDKDNCNNAANVIKPSRDVKSINSVNNNINNSNNNNNINNNNNNQSVLTIIKNTNVSEVQCKIVKTQNATVLPLRTKSEPDLIGDKKEKRYRRKSARLKPEDGKQMRQFGYEIEDVNEFLTKVSASFSAYGLVLSRLKLKYSNLLTDH